MNRIANNRRNKEMPFESSAGFTLIELLIAMAIASIIMAAAVSLYAGMAKSYTAETVKAAVQQDVRSALDLMAQDIRMAGLDPTGNMGAGFIISDADDIEFTADLDYDGSLTAGNNERIRYFLNGTQLVQRIDDDGTLDQVLLDNVSTLNLTYIFETGATEPSIVVITLAVQSPAGRRGMVSRTLTEQVRIRNISI